MTSVSGKSVKFAAALLGSTGLMAVAVPAAYAQSEQARSYNVPAQSLTSAAAQLSEQAGMQLVVDSSVGSGIQSGAVNGRMTANEALQRMLAGTGLTWRSLGNGTITIEKPADVGDGERVLGAVRVEGSQGSPYFGGAGKNAGVNGINGSKDITATEGTGSFTSGALTIGSKAPQAIKDVPQSISILTSERFAQQNISEFTEAMNQLPGVAAVQGSSNMESSYYSRGFQIDKIQIDGGAPLQTRFGMNGGQLGYLPQIDLSQYDHVEILRGATGTLNGYGSPSGSINLVRKRPLSTPQLIAEVRLGSWENYRVVLDATSPLGFEGKVRGRLVMAFEDREYFYDTAEQTKATVYAIAEADIGPGTMLTAGTSITKQRSTPWLGGLALYENGEDLELPRSSSFAFPWNRWDTDTTEFFGSVDQEIGRDWHAKLNATFNHQRTYIKAGTMVGSVNPVSNLGPRLGGVYADLGADQLSLEGTINGSFQIFGQRQEVVLGANYANSNGNGRVDYQVPISRSAGEVYQPYPGGPSYCYQPFNFPGFPQCPPGTIPPATPPIDVFDFDPRDPRYSEFANPLAIRRYPHQGDTQLGFYANFRFTAFDRLHLTTGIRWSKYESQTTFEELCVSIPATQPSFNPNCFGRKVGDAYRTDITKYKGNEFSWPPAVNISYDVTNDLTGYVGYTDIYINQGDSLDADLNPVDPITGSNIEAGIKWAPRSGKVNFSASIYKITQKGFYTEDGVLDFDVTPEDLVQGIDYYFVASNGRRVPNGRVGARACCFKSDPDRFLKSKGFDLDLTGEIFKQLQVSASYTYNDNKQVGTFFGSGENLPIVTIAPKHLYKLWATYRPGASDTGSASSRLSLSAGINGQSSGYYSGFYCEQFGPPNPTGNSACLPGARKATQFTSPARALVSTRIAYQVGRNWEAAMYVENLFDKRYYSGVASSPSDSFYYGTPRSLTLSLRGKW